MKALLFLHLLTLVIGGLGIGIYEYEKNCASQGRDIAHCLLGCDQSKTITECLTGDVTDVVTDTANKVTCDAFGYGYQDSDPNEDDTTSTVMTIPVGRVPTQVFGTLTSVTVSYSSPDTIGIDLGSGLWAFPCRADTKSYWLQGINSYIANQSEQYMVDHLDGTSLDSFQRTCQSLPSPPYSFMQAGNTVACQYTSSDGSQIKRLSISDQRRFQGIPIDQPTCGQYGQFGCTDPCTINWIKWYQSKGQQPPESCFDAYDQYHGTTLGGNNNQQQQQQQGNWQVPTNQNQYQNAQSSKIG